MTCKKIGYCLAQMERYKNLSGDSGVVSYEIGADFIWVMFSDGARYLYTYERTGARNVEQMKQLARNGRGLSSFISANHAVRNGYAKRER
jgi:hypothetical protein